MQSRLIDDKQLTGQRAGPGRARGWVAASALVAALVLQACGGGEEAADSKPLAAAPPPASKLQQGTSSLAQAAAAATSVDLLSPDSVSTFRVEQVADGALQVTISVGNGTDLTGDIRAFYFHLSGDQSQGLVVSGDRVTRVKLGTNSVTQAGGKDTKLSRTSGVNTTGGFDVGVEIGTKSINGADDVQSTVITLTRPGGLTLADFRFVSDGTQGTAYLGLVVNKVGVPGTRRGDDINSVFEPVVVMPPPPPPPPPARAYDVGAAHLCVDSPPRINCYGNNDFGQSPLFPVSYVVSATKVATGLRHSCGIGSVLVGGATFVPDSVACWGGGAAAVLPQPALGPAAKIAAGDDTTCVLTVAGAVTCWATTTDANALNTYTVSGLGTVVDIAVGSSRACAVDTGGIVRCWFKDSGADALAPSFNTPMLQVDAWGGVACATNANGGAECWGISAAQVVPNQPPATLTGVTQVAVGNNFACAATTGGSVSCWGTSLTPPDARVLAIPAGLTDVRSVEAGGDTVCADRQTGVVVCWGALNLTDPRLPE